MLILLPPSEKKKAATGQHKFELSDLAFASELLAARSSALLNQEILPTAEAIEIYDGVLYQGLIWKDLSDANRIRANSRILIISAKYRGELTRHLLLQPSDPQNPAELQRMAAELFECELCPPNNGGPWTLDLLIS